MIGRFLIALLFVVCAVGVLALLGWGIETMLEHHMRVVIGFAVCALAAIVYAETGPASLEQH